MAKLHFHYGTMNSGKSAQLLMKNNAYKEQGKKTLVFKPKVDTRDGYLIKSRALGTEIRAVVVDREEYSVMTSLVREVLPDIVLVDEVQFFPEYQVDELSKIVDILGVTVICYGLMTDFRAELFAGSKRLIELGAEMTEIKTVCSDCKENAAFNMRVQNGVPIFYGEQVLIGNTDTYKPVCRNCYNKYRQDNILFNK